MFNKLRKGKVLLTTLTYNNFNLFHLNSLYLHLLMTIMM
jgi:hypothetical protein